MALNDNTLEGRDVVKFLGIHIDAKLKFGNHIDILNKKLARGCYMVKTVAQELGMISAKTAYHALVESHLRYGIAFWGYSTQSSIQSVFVLQKRAVRYVCQAKCRDSCKPLFIKHEILTVPCIFILETACLIFKKFQGFERESHYNLRQNNLPLPIPKLALTKNSVIYESVRIFNELPTEIKNTNDYSAFRRNLKKFLLVKAYYSLQEFYS